MKTKVTPHPFVDNPDLSDPRMNIHVCRNCGLVGQPGDTHHTMPDAVPDVMSAAAGEKRDA
ncbi:hypothetical protein [Actinoplanes italicus]|uniref:hypothetical protein n=1 Tax=Actinoplanes italicus TaxID=113567 RepID=UPI000D080CD8|nr:hypothetical protein [Actinoplanes italicus]